MFPIMVKYTALLMPKAIGIKIDRIIQAIDKKWIEKDPDHLDIFEGANYP